VLSRFLLIAALVSFVLGFLGAIGIVALATEPFLFAGLGLWVGAELA
jgi:hypothetical protein